MAHDLVAETDVEYGAGGGHLHFLDILQPAAVTGSTDVPLSQPAESAKASQTTLDRTAVATSS